MLIVARSRRIFPGLYPCCPVGKQGFLVKRSVWGVRFNPVVDNAPGDLPAVVRTEQHQGWGMRRMPSRAAILSSRRSTALTSGYGLRSSGSIDCSVADCGIALVATCIGLRLLTYKDILL